MRRNYYDVLGVSRDADEAAVKKAFRRLARELHPDVSDDPEAEERFKEAVEAYEVLSSSERRELYDRYGHEGLQSRGFAPSAFDFGNLTDLFSAFFGDDVFLSRRARRGADVATEVTVQLVEAAQGVSREIAYQAAVVCGECDGSGAEPGTSPVTCAACQGSGRMQQVSRSIFGDLVRMQTCGRCAGEGTVVESPCAACAGAGRRLEDRVVEITVPAGIHDGQRIRISGEGHAGEAGSRAGDVYVLVRVLPDERFVREGDDIFSTVDVTIAQAALGATLAVETLDGDVELELELGVQPGHVHVLSGRGMPVLSGAGRGDHRVLVNVRVPRRLSADQRRLLESFAAVEDAQMYDSEEGGLFDRLRAHFR